MAELELTPIEIACGRPLGLGPPVGMRHLAADPLAALGAAIEPALRRPPCLVSFSGGVDSSLVLAVAIRVARGRGLPDPIPISWRFNGAPAAEESRWQELVVAALGIGEWERIAADEDLDLVGPVAQRVLLRHGLMSPANAFLHEPLLHRAAGGALLTGIGGDQVLGLWRGRALADVIARRRRPTRRTALSVARAASPVSVRALLERRRMPGWDWLSPLGRRRASRALARERAADPVAWGPHLRWQLARRDTAVFNRTMRRIADGAGAMLVNPLLDPGFVAALARAGSRTGFGNRRATIMATFPGVLPVGLVDRTDKAMFDEVFWGASTRTLTRNWAGDIVDEELIDTVALRSSWSTGAPSMQTALLVQQVWLGANAEENAGDAEPPPRRGR